MRITRTHKSLDVYKLSKKLVLLTYQFTESLGLDEKYGLKSQMNRASVSIVANIAEGAARGSDKSYHHFLSISRGSLSELDALYDICYELKLINEENLDPREKIMSELSNKLSAFMKKLKSSE